MDRLRRGDDAAAREVFQRYAARLIALARSRIEARLQSKVDPEDVLQSVLRSFFVRQEAGQFALASWGDLWSLLVVMTLRKCADRADYFRARRRDAACEVGGGCSDDALGGLRQALDPNPTPDEAALLSDVVERLLGIVDVEDRPVLELSLQGYTTQEISARLGRAERSVRRLREHARKWLEHELAADAA
jgi:RNA polymerase sigma-70 factor (ECF subfamily)